MESGCECVECVFDLHENFPNKCSKERRVDCLKVGTRICNLLDARCTGLLTRASLPIRATGTPARYVEHLKGGSKSAGN
jgi:hypothetical protein